MENDNVALVHDLIYKGTGISKVVGIAALSLAHPPAALSLTNPPAALSLAHTHALTPSRVPSITSQSELVKHPAYPINLELEIKPYNIAARYGHLDNWFETLRPDAVPGSLIDRLHKSGRGTQFWRNSELTYHELDELETIIQMDKDNPSVLEYLTESLKGPEKNEDILGWIVNMDTPLFQKAPSYQMLHSWFDKPREYTDSMIDKLHHAGKSIKSPRRPYDRDKQAQEIEAILEQILNKNEPIPDQLRLLLNSLKVEYLATSVIGTWAICAAFVSVMLKMEKYRGLLKKNEALNAELTELRKQIHEIPARWNCAICLCDIEDNCAQYNCFHRFHSKCLNTLKVNELSAEVHKCPLCRKEVDGILLPCFTPKDAASHVKNLLTHLLNKIKAKGKQSGVSRIEIDDILMAVNGLMAATVNGFMQGALYTSYNIMIDLPSSFDVNQLKESVEICMNELGTYINHTEDQFAFNITTTLAKHLSICAEFMRIILKITRPKRLRQRQQPGRSA